MGGVKITLNYGDNMVFTPLSITSFRSVTVGFGKVSAFCFWKG